MGGNRQGSAVGDKQTVVIATGNAGKLKEFHELLMPLGLTVAAQSQWGTPEAEETGLTFVENALIKARNACVHTGLPAIADDSGLVVPSLDGAPGIYSARYSDLGTDQANNERLLAEMEGMEGTQREAYFYCAVASLKSPDDPVPVLATAAWHGRILTKPAGDQGFGYDPLFWVADHQCASAQLPRATKNALSHRGRAVQHWFTAWQGRNGH